MKKLVLFSIFAILLTLVILCFLRQNQGEYQKQINQILSDMSLEEKIGQVLLVRLPEDGISVINSHSVAGFILFRKDFDQLTVQQVQQKLQHLQDSSRIPLLIATDEEGGTVVRVSSNPLLHHEPFSSPREQYKEGGISQVLATTKEKNELLLKLGINLNLAPVADIATHMSDYMYHRSIGLSPIETGTYIQKVVTLCNQQTIGCTLKHFPGYGNNQDTHTDIVKDSRSYEFLQKNDLVPFQMGIDAKATSILMSHNIITAIDAQNPASLSRDVHQILRDEMQFKGVIMTDDLDMGAVSHIDTRYVTALQAGNDLLLVTDYNSAYTSLYEAIQSHEISIDTLDQAVSHVLRFKYQLHLLH